MNALFSIARRFAPRPAALLFATVAMVSTPLAVGATDTDDLATLLPPMSSAVGCGANITGAALGLCLPNVCTSVTQNGRIFRDGVASACDPKKNCPAGTPFGSTANLFDVYTYDVSNPGTPCNCVTVNLNVGTCGANVHAQAFSGVFTAQPTFTCGTPALGFEYLGDVGSSVSQKWSFEIPPTATKFSLVFGTNNGVGSKGCTYSASVTCAATPSIGCALLPVNQKLDALEAKGDALPCQIYKLLDPKGAAKAAAAGSGPCK